MPGIQGDQKGVVWASLELRIKGQVKLSGESDEC